jgi:hypothetical protein
VALEVPVDLAVVQAVQAVQAVQVVEAVLVVQVVPVAQVVQVAEQVVPVVLAELVLVEQALQAPLVQLARLVLVQKHLLLVRRQVRLHGKRPEGLKVLVLTGKANIIRLRQESRKHQRKRLRHHRLVVVKLILTKICAKKPLTI